MSEVFSESKEQMYYVQWMRRTYPEHRIFAIPNGGKRSIVTAARMKAEGVTKGLPDLFIPSLRLWVEMKRIKNSSTSPEQVDWMKYLTEHDYKCLVCFGFEDARNKTQSFLSVKKT